jgi:hypothetical protein
MVINWIENRLPQWHQGAKVHKEESVCTFINLNKIF